MRVSKQFSNSIEVYCRFRPI